MAKSHLPELSKIRSLYFPSGVPIGIRNSAFRFLLLDPPIPAVLVPEEDRPLSASVYDFTAPIRKSLPNSPPP